MPKWGMVIDLQRCIGCYSCMVACKQEHFLPPDIFWNRVLIGEAGKYPTVTKLTYPVLCNHCNEAPCVDVCPTGATVKSADGIVTVDYDKCIGCRSCMIACPYQQRTFNGGRKKEYFPGQGLTELELFGKSFYPLQEGTVVKCNFCIERIREGANRGLKPGKDWDATPACVNACPTKARYFGDLDNSTSEIATLIKERRADALHPEYGTEPSVYYVKR